MALPRRLLSLAALTLALTAGATASADPHTFVLPNSADAACEVDGHQLLVHLATAPSPAQLTLPRLNNVVLDLFWTGRSEAATAEPIADDPAHSRYLAPFLPPAEQLLSLSQDPQQWRIALPDAIAYPATIHVRCDSPPQYSPEGHTCSVAADGTITLPARHGIVTSEKLQFEPLTHKNTIGYWVNQDDFVEWLLATPHAGTWDVHVMQGCGAGQGGSVIRIAAGESSLEHTVVETGHFQNFRWVHAGSLSLPASDSHRLRVSCVQKNKNAVMDIRQIRLLPRDASARAALSVSQSEPDVLLPPFSSLPPAAGRRVLMRLPGNEAAACYHTLSLPTDWQPGQRYPVLVEWAGNGPYRAANGDTNSGRVEDATLAQGLAGTDGMIVLGLPFLDGEGGHNVSQWWGTPPTYDHEPSVAYAKAAIHEVCEHFGGDAERVVLVGFSRGSIACNALGLADDEIASLWQAAVCFSHYDGLRAWPFPGSTADAAARRLSRLGNRSQLILAESTGDAAPGQTNLALEATRRHLDDAAPPGRFTFLETGYVNHDDDWAMRPSATRQAARDWLRDVLRLPPRQESL